MKRFNKSVKVLTCSVQGVDLGTREPDIHILHDHRVLPHVKQIHAPNDAPVADSPANVGGGVRPAAAVTQAQLPALGQGHVGAHRRFRRLRQLHPVHRPEAVSRPTAQVGAPGAATGPAPLLPLLRRPGLEPRQAATLGGLADLAHAETECPALVVAITRVARVVPVAAPRAVAPHVALQLPRRAVQDQPRQSRRVADVVGIVCLVGVGHDHERVALGVEVLHAGEHHAVPRPARVDPLRAAEKEELGQSAHDQLERVGPRRGVGRASTRRDVSGDALLEVHPELHAGQHRVRRVVEALPRHALARPTPVRAQDEVAVVEKLSGDLGGYISGGRRGGPDCGVPAVDDDQAAVGGELEDAGGADDRAPAVGDPHDGLYRDARVPNAEVGSGIGASGRVVEAEPEDSTG
ncbi:hypothetical protein CFC21_058621 [Triticum aestivum]|uniref:Uncharacterized protein n=2 Tax=Triticum aestivum TaxID=4565 RepID=A0A9R1KDP0_WHEAT|nr:hypothetical protein CFC21_058621 [Triticum aestivum]